MKQAFSLLFSGKMNFFSNFAGSINRWFNKDIKC
jgi:hypothetical protein